MGVHYDCELPFPILSLVVLKFSKVYRKQERVASHLDGRVSPSFMQLTRICEEKGIHTIVSLNFDSSIFKFSHLVNCPILLLINLPKPKGLTVKGTGTISKPSSSSCRRCFEGLYEGRSSGRGGTANDR